MATRGLAKSPDSLPVSFRVRLSVPVASVSAKLAPGASRRLRTQPLDLAARQRDADFADPFQLHAGDWLGVEAREIDDLRRLSPLDRLEVTLAALQTHGGFLAEKARQRMPLVAIDHDNVAIFIFRQHGITHHLEGDGFFRDREGQFDFAEPLWRHLLEFGTD